MDVMAMGHGQHAYGIHKSLDFPHYLNEDGDWIAACLYMVASDAILTFSSHFSFDLLFLCCC